MSRCVPGRPRVRTQTSLRRPPPCRHSTGTARPARRDVCRHDASVTAFFLDRRVGTPWTGSIGRVSYLRIFYVISVSGERR